MSYFLRSKLFCAYCFLGICYVNKRILILQSNKYSIFARVNFYAWLECVISIAIARETFKFMVVEWIMNRTYKNWHEYRILVSERDLGLLQDPRWSAL